MIAAVYLSGKSFLHKCDPRIKLFFLLFLLVYFFLPLPLFKYLILTASIVVTGIVATGLKDMLNPLKIIAPLLILILILTPPFYTGGRVYLELFDKPIITGDGLSEACHLIVRFLSLTYIFHIFLRTTKIEELVLSLRFFGISYKIALVISMTMRYIPYIISMYEGTLDAHRMRLTVSSPVISKWNFLARFLHLLSVLTSVLIQAVRSIPCSAMALETKGVGRSNPPGKMKKMKGISKLYSELILSFIIILVIVMYIYL